MITYCVENVVVWNKHIIIVFIKTIWHTSIIYQLENDISIRNIYKVLIKILCHNINRLCHNQKHTYTMLNKILCHTQIMYILLSKSETKKKNPVLNKALCCTQCFVVETAIAWNQLLQCLSKYYVKYVMHSLESVSQNWHFYIVKYCVTYRVKSLKHGLKHCVSMKHSFNSLVFKNKHTSYGSKCYAITFKSA